MCFSLPLALRLRLLALLAILSLVSSVRPTRSEETLIEYTRHFVWQLQGIAPASCQKQVEGLFESLLNLRTDMPPSKAREEWEDGIADFMWNPRSKPSKLPRVVRMKLTQLAMAEKDAMLWAGFWEGHGAEPNRTTKQALLHFADLMGMQTVHPGTAMGRLVQKQDDLSECGGPSFKDPEGILASFWSKASRLFIEGIFRKKQEFVLVLVNKDLNPAAERSLAKSVLWEYELPSMKSLRRQTTKLAKAWNPKIVLVDMRGTCNKLTEAVNHLMGNRTIFQVACINCIYPCQLDNQLRRDVMSVMTGRERPRLNPASANHPSRKVWGKGKKKAETMNRKGKGGKGR